MKVYTVYSTNAKLSKTGKPYIGTTTDLRTRASVHKSKLKLNFTPEMTVLFTTTDIDEAWNVEQKYKVENGWPRETQNYLKICEKGGITINENGKFKVAQSKGGKSIKGMIWIKNGKESTRICVNELQSYIEKGYIRGRVNKNNKK